MLVYFAWRKLLPSHSFAEKTNPMNPKLLLLSVSILLIISCSSNKQLVSNWHQENYENPSDISRIEYQYHPEYKIFYFVSNDSDKLYFHLKVDDRNVQKRLLVNGFTIWLDSNAKAKKYLGARYQVDPNKLLKKANQLDYILPPDEKGNAYGMHTYLIKNTMQELIGFDSIFNKTQALDFLFVQDSTQSLNFLLTVPLKFIAKKHSKTNTISLIIESELPYKKEHSDYFQETQVGGRQGGGRMRELGGPNGKQTAGGLGNNKNGKFSIQNTKPKPIEIIIKKLNII